jgi:hypothetical protein
LTVYENIPVNFIGMDSWYIYWMEAFPRSEKELNCLRKELDLFYWYGVVMTLIEWWLFHG